MGISLASLQRGEEAVLAYHASIDSALNSPGASRAGDPYWNLALALRGLGRVSETVEALEAFIDLAPVDDKRLINARSQLQQDRRMMGHNVADDTYGDDDDYYGEGGGMADDALNDDDEYDESEEDMKLQFVNSLGSFATS